MPGDPQHGRRLQFRFTRADDDKPAVPASVLIQTLESAQRAIWLIALSKEQREIKSRARIPDDIEQRYQLKCELPVSGSYLLPAIVESLQPKLESIDQVEDVLLTFENVASALNDQSRERVAAFLPDSAIRHRVVSSFQQLAPKPGSGWRLDLSRNSTTVRLDEGWQRRVRKMYTVAASEPARETVNGELIEINFANRQITVRPLDSAQRITVTYPEDMEDLLLENRRSIIQITGRVLRGENQEIRDLFEPESIGPLDLSPLELSEVEHAGIRLRFRTPVLLAPRLDEENAHFIVVREPRLGLDAFAGTVPDLLDEVAEDLIALWRNIALAPEAQLSPRSLDLKRSLLAELEEVPLAG